ncbi:aminoacyl tRNA synthase complex-interacting multifunctional protein 1 isoform X3 [Heterocephalus glaber]|uniref:Aminoacyl tRNA synthase complex-interacting multifunctional protein 1 isoform X3 n=1 Tax=Heterocephalus glaber TaxID=10181 RepID=A0AAX6RVX7_HETGA|nr:aminoacyl tRNA synthase complex-interacting multifunctional protein 1 isoform X3 [Heterocephalus glaber]
MWVLSRCQRVRDGVASCPGATVHCFMVFCRFLAKMTTSEAVLKRLEQKGAEADQIIGYLKQQVALLKEKAILQATLREEKKLRVENAKLKKEIEELKQELIQAEIQNGGEKKEKKQLSAAGSADSKPVDASRLDLRIGCIINAKKHPDADSLYVEEIDVGETAPKTVVSGLVNHIPLEQLQNRMVVLLCNLKPAKMRGVLSQAMVMCASSPEKVEILAPPEGSVPGDRVTFDAFPGEPDKELNPKKKIWEQIQPDLYTSDECVATYRGIPFEVKGKGVVRAQTMAKSGIK